MVRRAALLAIFALSAWPALAADRFDLPDGPGRKLVYGHCQTCHDLQSLVDSAGIGRGAWDAVLDNMRQFGLRLTEDQRAQILDYLATYLGPNPPAAAGEGTVAAADADGAAVYAEVCVACHQEDGAGKAGEFPPLAANPDLFLSPAFPALVVLNGIAGPIEVEGQAFDNAMPALDVLLDAEIAAVVNHIRSSWGNGELAAGNAETLTPQDVGTARAQAMTADEVHARRDELKR